jgi:prepilin-type N-terminal cleavage/methylation domain-containing protein
VRNGPGTILAIIPPSFSARSFAVCYGCAVEHWVFWTRVADSMRKFQRRRGFTLLELLMVITIIGIISAVVITRISHQALDAKKKCCMQYCADINSAIEVYRFEKGGPPAALSALEGAYYPEAIPNCPVNGSAYAMDPTTLRVTAGHNH